MMFCSAVSHIIIITAALIMASIVIEGFTPEGGGIRRVHTRGGGGGVLNGAPLCAH